MPGSGLRMPTKAESTTNSKISSSLGQLGPPQRLPLRTLLVNSAVRTAAALLADELDHRALGSMRSK